MPSAPALRSLLIFSQKSSSDMTVCTAHHPSSANGTMVGLLMPESKLLLASILLRSVFNTTYLLSFARRTDRNLHNNSCTCSFSSAIPFFAIRPASEVRTSRSEEHTSELQ